MKIKEVTVSLAKESLSIDCCKTKPKYQLAQQRIRKKKSPKLSMRTEVKYSKLPK